MIAADDAAVEFPGPGDLVFDFRETAEGRVMQSITFPGPWAIFRLIKDPNVKTVTREGNKWSLEYVVGVGTGADRRNFSLWLTLEFKQPVPDVKDWPVPPGRTAN